MTTKEKLQELLKESKAERENMPCYSIILNDGKRMYVQQLPDGIYSSPNGEMFFVNDEGRPYKKECRGTTVFRCTPAGEAISSVGNIDVRALWEDFGDVPMNPETECLDEQWHQFAAGTFREDVWHWFEQEFGVSVGKLMNDIGGHKYFLNHRPLSIGTVPNGFVDYDENDKGGRYGAVYYFHRLTEQEVQDYELIPAHI